jgi:hypothetical protein
MTEIKFQSPWDKPVDPAYEAFESGWKRWVEDGGVFRYPGTRWTPAKAAWNTYPAPRWEMLDRGVPDLRAPDSPFGLTLPQVFKQVQERARAYPQYPGLIWNPYTGVWREARDTGRPPQPPPPPPPPPPEGPVDAAKRKARADREREMSDAYAEYARNAIDVVTLNQRIAEIDARYARLIG